MDILVLTKSSTFIIGPIASILGYIMEGIYNLCEFLFGSGNIGVCIILFTVIVNILMLPLTIKQQKFQKLNAVMSPELQAVQKKYRGKKDQASALRMQDETKAVYEKYGTSPAGGCLQLILQMPLLFALYQVIYRIPAYVSSIKELYMVIVNGLKGIADFASNTAFVELATKNRVTDLASDNTLVDLFYAFDSNEWLEFKKLFPSLNEIVDKQLVPISRINSFLGVNLMDSPGFAFPGILIPILAGLTQWLSSYLMQGSTKNAPSGDADQTASTMKAMNTFMPIISVVICFSLPSCIGVYWIASSAVRCVIQLFVNKYMNGIDIEVLVEKNIQKSNKKRERKGLPPNKVPKIGDILNKEPSEEEVKIKENLRREQIEKSTEYYKAAEEKASSGKGRLSSKANMVQRYNERMKK